MVRRFNSKQDFITKVPEHLRRVSEADFERCAIVLGCRDTRALKAVMTVESSGRGFASNGLVKILFEPHIFNRYTNGRYLNVKFNGDHRKVIASKSWDKKNYPSSQDGVYQMFLQAMNLNYEAALMSASWGLPQIMGFNYNKCGFATVEDFVYAMTMNEAKHLEAFTRIIMSFGIDDELMEVPPDFDGFAYVYNGAGYKKNDYAGKMRRAYNTFSSKPYKDLTGASANTSITYFKSAVKNGTKNKNILALQKELNRVLKPSPNLVEDSIFGPRTKLALEAVLLQRLFSSERLTQLRAQGIVLPA